MEIEQYFNKIDFTDFVKDNLQWRYSLGKEIEKNTVKFLKAEKKKANIILVGVTHDSNLDEKHSSAPNLIRKELYKLSNFQTTNRIVDLGNLKKAKTEDDVYFAVRDITEYAIKIGAIVILIGGSQDITIGLAKAFRNQKYFSLTNIDSLLDIKYNNKQPNSSDNYLTTIFKSSESPFQFNLIGYQSHLFSDKLFNKFKAVNFNLRLGLLQEDIARSESILRNSDIVSIDMNVLKSTESPGSKRANANGMRSQEICELAKYAGFSNRIKALGLFETYPIYDERGITSQLAAQVIWYFIQGCLYRNIIPITEKSEVKTYRVEIDEVDNALLFYKDEELNLWWLRIETKSKEKIIVACDEIDYYTAKENQIPEIYLKYLIELDDLQK